MVPRTVATAAPPISAPTSCTPDSAVTSVLFTRLSTPTATISLLVIAPWTARATAGLAAVPPSMVSSRRVLLPSVRADGFRAAMDLSSGEGDRGDRARGPMVSSNFVYDGGNTGSAPDQQPFPRGQRGEPQRAAQRR